MVGTSGTWRRLFWDLRCLETSVLGQTLFGFPNLTVEVAASLASSPLVFHCSSACVSIIRTSFQLKSSRLSRTSEATFLSCWGPTVSSVAENSVTLVKEPVTPSMTTAFAAGLTGSGTASEGRRVSWKGAGHGTCLFHRAGRVQSRREL